jgi:hypothetical protein
VVVGIGDVRSNGLAFGLIAGTAGLSWVSGTCCSTLFGRDDVGEIRAVAEAGSDEG